MALCDWLSCRAKPIIIALQPKLTLKHIFDAIPISTGMYSTINQLHRKFHLHLMVIFLFFQSYNSHADESDPDRIQQIIQRSVDDAEWVLKKVSTVVFRIVNNSFPAQLL